jgi:hypothetical protein
VLQIRWDLGLVWLLAFRPQHPPEQMDPPRPLTPLFTGDESLTCVELQDGTTSSASVDNVITVQSLASSTSPPRSLHWCWCWCDRIVAREALVQTCENTTVVKGAEMVICTRKPGVWVAGDEEREQRWVGRVGWKSGRVEDRAEIPLEQAGGEERVQGGCGLWFRHPSFRSRM